MEKYGTRTFDEVLERLILSDLAPLKNEVRDILVEEFGRDHGTYHEILSSMALGKTKKKEIGDSTHIESTSLSPYLYDLGDIMGLTEWVVPVTEDPNRSKKGRYFLKDHFFRFHYRFLYRNMSDYQIGNYDLLKDIVKSGWSEHRGRIFEDASLNFVKSDRPLGTARIGKYWDRMSNEIDILGVDGKGKVVLAVEVKARKMTDRQARGELSRLEEKVNSIFRVESGIRVGIIGIEIRDKERIREDGFYCMDLKDMTSPG